MLSLEDMAALTAAEEKRIGVNSLEFDCPWIPPLYLCGLLERIRKVCCIKLKRPIDCTATVRFKIKRKQEIILYEEKKL